MRQISFAVLPLWILGFVLFELVTPSLDAAEPALGQIQFNRDIRPILANNCFKCHGPDTNKRQADLRLDLEEHALASRDGEPVIVPGKPAQSAVIARILSDSDDEQMPPKASGKFLTPREKQLLQAWIQQGARWQGHWAWTSPQRPAIPRLETVSPTGNAIDHFIHAQLREKKLAPSPTADRRTLVRRLYFDLTGLPADPAIVTAFLKDSSPEAYEKLVDTLLASPHFGERMAIYWLDVVRYADSNGYHADKPRQISPYRDYVINVFNNNKPYDQFIVEQLAGDLLPNPTPEQKVASGFNMLLQTTDEGGAQAKEYLAKYAADRVRNTSSIFLGVTMGCAECHNHKFDPFTTEDFYSMAAFFSDIKEVGVGNAPAYPVATAAHQAQLKKIDAELATLKERLQQETPRIKQARTAWEAKLSKQAETTVQLDAWYQIGPFPAANFDEGHQKAFPPETEVDYQKTYDKFKWQKAPQLVDGKVHTLAGINRAFYFHRNIQAPSDRPLKISLGSDDSFKLWINGKLAAENKVQRGAVADQEKLTLFLQEGNNELLLKIVNASGPGGFYFRADQLGIPPQIVKVLGTAEAKRNDAQRKQLADYYRSVAPEFKVIRDQVSSLEQKRKQAEQSMPKTLMTVATKPRMTRILPRGNWLDETGTVVKPHVPAFMKPLEVGERSANRLDLAQWITSPEHPLTSRVFVNRLWHLFFGQGLAQPLDDLGTQGTLPSHPELLDYLAVEFREKGWNVKSMIKTMVMSDTYRQTSVGRQDLQQQDPYNHLYGRQARFRLDAEFVRDNALAVSGLLVRDIGGQSVKPYQPAGYWRHMNFPARTWQASSGNNLYRRGLYTWWQRMFLHPSLLAFDAPSREECTVERPRSNTPQQALVLLNDPTYVEAARAFAERILREGGKTPAQRLDWAYQQVLARNITPYETKLLVTLVEKHLVSYRADMSGPERLSKVGMKPAPKDLDPVELASYTSIARVILNLHETITRQ
ncbi:MAG: PSD1 and planctomycete cytochrome C domain-containing protein [Planctomycetota bacterium]|nr:PSD1 and planctomycete cytochrome C domain-containing protein [Planctomycetota bacterium]